MVDEYKNEDLVLVLKMIVKKTDLRKLNDYGFEYLKISKLIEHLEENKLTYNGYITKKGLDFISDNKKIKILPFEKYHLKKFHKFDIYLP